MSDIGEEVKGIPEDIGNLVKGDVKLGKFKVPKIAIGGVIVAVVAFLALRSGSKKGSSGVSASGGSSDSGSGFFGLGGSSGGSGGIDTSGSNGTGNAATDLINSLPDIPLPDVSLPVFSGSVPTSPVGINEYGGIPDFGLFPLDGSNQAINGMDNNIPYMTSGIPNYDPAEGRGFVPPPKNSTEKTTNPLKKGLGTKPNSTGVIKLPSSGGILGRVLSGSNDPAKGRGIMKPSTNTPVVKAGGTNTGFIGTAAKPVVNTVKAATNSVSSFLGNKPTPKPIPVVAPKPITPIINYGGSGGYYNPTANVNIYNPFNLNGYYDKYGKFIKYPIKGAANKPTRTAG